LIQHESEFFAAFTVLKPHCNVREVIKELFHKGADFIFLCPHQYPNFDSNLLSNVYSGPVFFMRHANPDFFHLDKGRRSISIFFPMPEKSVYGHTELDFFYVPSSPLTHRFIHMAISVKKVLKSKVVLNPVIFTFSSKSEEFINNNCVSKGEFCAYDPDNEGKLTGRDVILEALRQKCIFSTHSELYLNYMDSYFRSCVDKISKSCSESIMSSVGVDKEAVQSCYDRSFASLEQEQVDNHNEILDLDRQMRKTLGVTEFPDFYINNVKYDGSMNIVDLLLSICSTNSQLDSAECRNLDLTPDLNEGITFIIVMNVVIFIIALVFLVAFIRRRMRNKFKKEVKTAIDKYMTEYSAIKNDNTNLA
jgi:hypothetical protein